VDAGGQNLIEVWLTTFPQNVRTKIRSKLVTIFGRANAEGRLKEPRYERLQGASRDLIRIGFELNRIQYRVFACYGDEGRAVVWLLAGGKEQNDRYRPPGILNTALERRANVLQGTSQVRATCLLNNN
jgi:hypothetical protein